MISSADGELYIVLRGLTAFSVFVCGGRRKGLVWYTVTTHLDTPPTMVGGC